MVEVYIFELPISFSEVIISVHNYNRGTFVSWFDDNSLNSISFIGLRFCLLGGLYLGLKLKSCSLRAMKTFRFEGPVGPFHILLLLNLLCLKGVLLIFHLQNEI